MTLSNKILIIVGSIIILCLSSILIYNQFQIIEQQKAIHTEMVKQKELQDNIVRSLTEYATRKDIEKIAKDNNIQLKSIEEDLNNLNARLTTINTISVINTPTTKLNQPSSSIGTVNPNPPNQTVNCNGTEIPCTNIDKYNYFKYSQNYKLYENFGNIKVPFGQVTFKAWEKNPWSESSIKREYKITNIVGVDENQRQYFYNKVSVIADGKIYDLKISKAETKQEYPMPKFNFNPRLFMGLDMGVNVGKMHTNTTANVSIGFFSYGKFKSQPDLALVKVGLGYSINDKNVNVHISPVSYNVGKHIPFMNNLYLGPSISVNKTGEISIMAGVKSAL